MLSIRDLQATYKNSLATVGILGYCAKVHIRGAALKFVLTARFHPGNPLKTIVHENLRSC